MNPLPKVSCYCATYGRPWALEESIESFLRQDYKGEKELIVLNDYAGHALVFNHPQVKVLNLADRITPLGKKFNETVALCSGEIIFPWEDDDVFLPNKISYSVDHMVDGLFHTHLAFYEQDGELIVQGNHFHCNMAVERSLWNKAGWYAEMDKCDLDIQLMHRLFEAAPKGRQSIDIEDIFYVYRWGTTGSYHASGWGSAEGTFASIGAQDIVRHQVAQGRIPQGPHVLNPHWSYDYIAAAQRAITKAQ